MIKLLVDSRRIEADQDASLLHVCLSNGIYIPHLCFLENDASPDAACRLCFVEIEGYPDPVSACTVRVSSELNVKTATLRVRRLQRTALRLLLSVHDVNCLYCPANRACALQQIARFLKIELKTRPLESAQGSARVDRSHPHIDLYPHRCVLCAKCIKTCRDASAHPSFTLTGRGIQTRVRHYPTQGDTAADCHACRQCISVCPVGALQLRKSEAGSNHGGV